VCVPVPSPVSVCLSKEDEKKEVIPPGANQIAGNGCEIERAKECEKETEAVIADINIRSL